MSFLFTRGGCVSCLRGCLGTTVILVSELSEGADRVVGQLHGNKEWPFSGVTKYGRVWRKVPESDARSVRKVPESGARSVRKVPESDARSVRKVPESDARSVRKVSESGARSVRKVPESDARSVRKVPESGARSCPLPSEPACERRRWGRGWGVGLLTALTCSSRCGPRRTTPAGSCHPPPPPGCPPSGSDSQ